MLYDLVLRSEVSSEHVQVFVDRYDQLLTAARLLANNGQGHAVDLVHDALIVFVHDKPDLGKINNMDGYLYGLVRNLAKRQKQRMNARSIYEHSVDNYNSVENRLCKIAHRYHNPQLLLDIQDVLRAICDYACFRKESLKTGSVLILRFFHGYHTSEIAQIMRLTSGAVSQLLKLARAEAYLYLNDPKCLDFSHESVCIKSRSVLNYGCLADDLVDELRRAIFQSHCSNKCLLQFKMYKLYEGKHQEKIDCKTLAHIVGCPYCLDAINSLLGLELLSMRYPTDALGKRAKDRRLLRHSQVMLKDRKQLTSRFLREAQVNPVSETK